MKKLIKKIFNVFGLHISKLTVVSSPAYQIVQALKSHDINVVFDIGANSGQFASELRMYGYKGKIISFEPLPEAYKTLLKFSERDDSWIIHPRCAIGDYIGEVEINVAGNSVSSSILPMLHTHEKAAPNSRYTHKELVPIITLDSVYEQYSKQTDNSFIKIDTQGYESQVLSGANLALGRCKGVLLELSLVPLYEGQKLWHELMDYLTDIQYKLYAIMPGFTDPLNGKTLQFDGVFFKTLK